MAVHRMMRNLMRYGVSLARSRVSRAAKAPRSGIPLPRKRPGGAHFERPADFIASGAREVRRLQQLGGLSSESRLLDFGCGPGRLAIGLIETECIPSAYLGLDVRPDYISYCCRFITRDHPIFQFRHVDARNQRYNPSGLDADRIPVPNTSYDIFYAYSVFSHMKSDQARLYFKEVARALADDGIALITAFVESGCVDEEENPISYGPFRWSGALHCVRYSRDFFEQIVTTAGLEVVDFYHRSDTDWQSLYVLTSARQQDNSS